MHHHEADKGAERWEKHPKFCSRSAVANDDQVKEGLKKNVSINNTQKKTK